MFDQMTKIQRRFSIGSASSVRGEKFKSIMSLTLKNFYHYLVGHYLSIVELMIVLGIVIYVTYIVNPIYTNYTTQAKISEALTLLAVLKNPMEKYYHSQNKWPSVVAVGEKTSGHYTSRIVSGEMNDDLFYVEATMKGDEILGGKQLRMTYEPSTRDWLCTVNDVENPIPSKYLPAYCRD